MHQWASKRGIKTYGLDWREGDDAGTRTIAAEPLAAEQTVLQTPYNNVMTETRAATSPLGKAAREIVPDISLRTLLYLQLISVWHDAGEEFHEYVRALPRVYDNPFWWTLKQRDLWLRGTNLHVVVESKRRWLEEEYERLFPRLSDACPDRFPAEQFTWSMFLWAHSLFASRAYPHYLSMHPDDPVTPMDVEASGCLIPVFDLLNHSPSAKMTWMRDNDGIRFIIHEDIAEGDEVFNCYGPKGNEELLLSFGFVVDENPADSTAVSVGLPPGDPNRLHRRRLLRAAGLLRPRYYITKGSPFSDGAPAARNVGHGKYFRHRESTTVVRFMYLHTELAAVIRIGVADGDTLGALWRWAWRALLSPPERRNWEDTELVRPSARRAEPPPPVPALRRALLRGAPNSPWEERARITAERLVASKLQQLHAGMEQDGGNPQDDGAERFPAPAHPERDATRKAAADTYRAGQRYLLELALSRAQHGLPSGSGEGESSPPTEDWSCSWRELLSPPTIALHCPELVPIVRDYLEEADPRLVLALSLCDLLRSETATPHHKYVDLLRDLASASREAARPDSTKEPARKRARCSERDLPAHCASVGGTEGCGVQIALDRTEGLYVRAEPPWNAMGRVGQRWVEETDQDWEGLVPPLQEAFPDTFPERYTSRLVFRAALVVIDRFAVVVTLGSEETIALLPDTINVSFAENLWATSTRPLSSSLEVDHTEQRVRVPCCSHSTCLLSPEQSASSAMGGNIAAAAGFGWGWYGTSSPPRLDWHPLATHCHIVSEKDHPAQDREEMLARLGLADRWVLESTDPLWTAAAAAMHLPRAANSSSWNRLRTQLQSWPRQPTPDEAPPSKGRRTQDSREWDAADDWDISGEQVSPEGIPSVQQSVAAHPLEPLLRELIDEAGTREVMDALQREIQSHWTSWADRATAVSEAAYSVVDWVGRRRL